jgi:hypothetical protein
MVVSTVPRALFRQLLAKPAAVPAAPNRTAVTTVTGSFMENPPKTKFGLVYVIGAIIPGILLGASISKNLAMFLEENDLFVADDDDD